jgi:hypothetical protein
MLFPQVGTADRITVYSYTSIAIGLRKIYRNIRLEKTIGISDYEIPSEHRIKKKLSEYRTNIVITHHSSTRVLYIC